MEHIISKLKECTTKKCRINYNGQKLFFTRDEKNGWWIQRSECELYGLIIKDDGTIVWGYPHLVNFKEGSVLKLQNYCLEKKENGSNVIISKYGDNCVIRTRMSIADDFPIPTFWSSTIDSIIDITLKSKIVDIRNQMLSKYKDYYVFEADGEYVGLKYQRAVKDLIPVEKVTDAHPEYVFYFELFGKGNVVFIDSECKYGMYDVDFGIALIDIFDKKSHIFLCRRNKENIARELGLPIVELMYDFSNTDDLLRSLPDIKRASDEKLIEGFVLKPSESNFCGSDIIKVKSDVVLHSAHRLDAILKGYIDINDIYNYISKVVSAEHLKQPEMFDSLCEQVAEEALADYPQEIVDKQKSQIQRRIAHQMAVMVADKITDEVTFTNPGDLFRFINTELPKRFEPLRSYIDFVAEKQIQGKTLREKAKKRRVDLFDKVAKFVMKKMNIDRGSY